MLSQLPTQAATWHTIDTTRHLTAIVNIPQVRAQVFLRRRKTNNRQTTSQNPEQGRNASHIQSSQISTEPQKGHSFFGVANNSNAHACAQFRFFPFPSHSRFLEFCYRHIM